MKKNKLIIATRRSPLALWQSHWIGRQLPVPYELLPLSTKGDEKLDQSLTQIGGKGLFVTALEEALLDGRADIAVHSMKDVPMQLLNGCEIAAIAKRGATCDAFVSSHYGSLDDMPAGAKVGTASARRKAILHYYYPHLLAVDVRGNVQTRLEKCDRGDYDALILAGAGLERLALNSRIRKMLDSSIWLPAPGQGAIGVECLSDQQGIKALLTTIVDQDTQDCVIAERAVSAALGGSCVMPLAAFAQIKGDKIELSAWLNSPGKKITMFGGRRDAIQLGMEVAQGIQA